MSVFAFQLDDVVQLTSDQWNMRAVLLWTRCTKTPQTLCQASCPAPFSSPNVGDGETSLSLS